MNPSKTSLLEAEVSELKILVQNLLAKVNKLTAENTALREEVRHLKKLKGKPNIRPNKKAPEDGKDNKDSKPASVSGNNPPPKSKRPRSQETGKTTKPSPSSVRVEICPAEGVQDRWRRKGYQDFTHVDVALEFTTTRYRREVWITPEDQTVIAPLPAHIKGRFGANLTAMVLDLYHSCSVTQPLLLDWLHSHGCPVSEGKLNDLLTHGHELFHQERDDIFETGIACSRMLLVDDTGARHDGKNGYCTVIGNDTFTVFASTSSKSRVNFLTLLQGQRRSHVLNPVAIRYMKQVRMADKWVDALSDYGETHFLNKDAWEAFLNDHKVFAKEQRRKATEAVLKAGLLSNGFPEAMIIHSDGARQFDTAFEHSLCWFHASRPLAKLIPGNPLERAARDWMEKQFWNLYDDIEAYCLAPTSVRKAEIEEDFNHWVTTQVDYPDLRYELGKLHRAREELLLILEHPWLPLHNNLSERQIREYVKRRKISGGTRSTLGQRCRDTFASLKKTCKLHGVSFSRYLKDRLSGAGVIPRLSAMVRRKSAQLLSGSAYGF
ncbi:MAG: transposase [Candidatus Thiodiazotropha sp. 6PLUC6]